MSTTNKSKASIKIIHMYYCANKFKKVGTVKVNWDLKINYDLNLTGAEF